MAAGASAEYFSPPEQAEELLGAVKGEKAAGVESNTLLPP